MKLKIWEIGMILEGVVSNVANFGAFVDIGVHQDGLVHISALTDRFVADPREVVKAGDIVKVKVMKVDIQRKRIALTMRLTDEPGEQNSQRSESQAMIVVRLHANKPQRQAEPVDAVMGGACCCIS